MAFEKAKVVKAAEKFLSQGKINAAIKEYRQIIENDEDDLTALNMLGDLLARAGENDEAVACFTRIAEHYREQEFRLKAIAMYKKIEKLKPRDPETAEKLAELYAAQGLIVDARAQHMVVADAHTRAGRTKESLQVLHKIADLDPQNTDVRLKLAEGYLKEDMQAEAVRAFSDAASRMLEKGELERALDAYSKALELRPNDKSVLRGLVSVHIALGTPEDAAELLEKAIESQPEDIELLEMLAHAYIQSEDATGAERAISLLSAQGPGNHRRYIEVVRLYLKLGNAPEAARILDLIIEPMLSGREENDILELINELLETEPEYVAGLRLLARVHWWQRDMDKLRAVLERLAESADAAGLVDDERYALTQLVRLAPDESRFAQRLEEIGGGLEEFEDVPTQDPSLANESASFGGFAIVEEEADEESAPPEYPAAEFEFNSVAEPTRTDANSSFADLNEPEEDMNAEIHIASEPVAPVFSTNEYVFGDTEESTAVVQENVDDQAGESRVQAMMQQELESVDFYITQGYSDIAMDTLELLERQFGPHPEIDSRRGKLRSGVTTSVDVIVSGVPVETEPTEISSEPIITTNEEPKASSQDTQVPMPSSGIDSGLAEIFEEFRLEAEGDDHASESEDYETHYNMATAYKEMDLLDEAIREFQSAAAIAAPADGTPRYFQCCNMLGHCFVEKSMPRAAVLWFKKGMDAAGRSTEEYKAIQYELGSAYEQMGELAEAVAAFTEVYGVDVGYRDTGERLNSLQARQKK